MPRASGRVYINPTQYFDGVEREVWEFTIGGYRPILVYLKARRGRQLTKEEVGHVCRVAAAIRQTIRIMGEIDAAIPSWPLE